MKTLELKVFKLGEQEVKYADLVRSCVNNVPQGGMNPQEIKARLRILEAVDKAESIVELEDSDASKLRELVSVMPWAIVSADVVAFCDAVDAL